MPYNSFSLNQDYILSHVLLDSQRDIAHRQYDVVHAFSLFFPQNAHFLVEPRRIGPPTRHRTLPIRRGSRFFSLFPSNCPLPCPATSHWTSNATSLPPNTTWLTLFRPFCLKILASYTSHVALDPQRDIAHFQHDVAAPLSTQKTTRAIRVAAYLLYLSSNVQSSLKLA